MIDKNGKEIFVDSLVKFDPLIYKESYRISKIYSLCKDGSGVDALKLHDNFYRNPYEVEVVTPEEAMLLILEYPTGNHHV